MRVTGGISPSTLALALLALLLPCTRFERQDATHAEAGFVLRNHAGSQASEHGQKRKCVQDGKGASL